MAPIDPRAMERLNGYLDEVAQGHRPVPDAVKPDLAAAVDLLRLRDDAPAARPAFADSLLEELMDAVGHPSPGRAASIRRPFAANGTEPTHSRAWAPFTLLFARRAWPLAQLASAAMLVLTLVGVVIAFGLLRSQEDGPIFDDSPVYRGGPARTGQQPGPGPKSPPTERWRFQTDGRTAPTPVLADGVLYFGGDDGVVWAVAAETGEARWHFTAAAAIGAPPAVSGDSVYVGDRTGVLYALNARTGELRWQMSVLTSTEAASFSARSWTYMISPVEVDGVVFVTSGEAPSAPAVAGGLVFVPSGSAASFVRAVDAGTGTPRWRFPEGESTFLTTAGVFALDAATGQQRWFVGSNGQVWSTPAVADGVVYVGSRLSAVTAVDTTTGSALWAIRTSDLSAPASPAMVTNTSPAVVDGIVYIGSFDGNLYALDAATGQERWRSAVGRVRSSLAVVAEGMVYVVAGAALHAVDAETGVERWQVPLGDGVDGSAVVAGGYVFVGMVTEDGKAALVALG